MVKKSVASLKQKTVKKTVKKTTVKAKSVRQLIKKSAKKETTKHVFEMGSSNIFADLGFVDAEELLAKAELTRQICLIIKRKRLTQESAAKLLHVDQPKISALLNGKISGFSIERLFKFLNQLGQDITIKIKPMARTKKVGDIFVGSQSGNVVSRQNVRD